MNKELIKIAKKYNVDTARADELTIGLNPFLEERKLLIDEFEIVSKLEITKENIPQFRNLRLKFQKNRTVGIINWHKITKMIPLRVGQLIDAIKNSEVNINETHEEFLKKNEYHFELIEAERLAELKAKRLLELEPYWDFVPLGIDLRNMEEEDYQKILTGAKLQRQAELDEEAKENQKLLADQKAKEAEQERIRLENIQLRKDAEIAEEKQLADEMERLEKQKIQDAKLEKEQKFAADKRRKRSQELTPYIKFIRDYNWLIDSSDADFKKELADIKRGAEEYWAFEKEQAEEKELADEKAAKEKEISDKKLAEETKLREKLEDDAKAANLKVKEAIDRKAEEDRRAELLPDKKKIIAFIELIEKTPIPVLKNKVAQQMVGDTKLELIKIVNKLLIYTTSM